MAIPAASFPRVTFEQYVELEADSHVRHEFNHGLVVAMAGGSPEHNALCANLTLQSFCETLKYPAPDNWVYCLAHYRLVEVFDLRNDRDRADAARARALACTSDYELRGNADLRRALLSAR